MYKIITNNESFEDFNLFAFLKNKENMSKLERRQIKRIEEIDNEIKNAVNEYEHEPNRYVMVSKKIGKGFTAKQIRQRWLSHLDPRICLEELDEDEKKYIIEWVKEYKNKNSSDKICWTKLISKMNSKFGKLRSENKVKNFYYLRVRQRKTNQLVPSNDESLLKS